MLVISLTIWLTVAVSTAAVAAPTPTTPTPTTPTSATTDPATTDPTTSSPPNSVGGPELASSDVVVDSRATPLPPDITASSWVVADADTGAVLAARDPHGHYLPASTLKILTALAVLPHLSPTQEITVSNAAASVDGTRVGLVPGMAYTAAELATAMLIASGNDAAMTLAEAAGGTDATIALMNRTAADLKARDTWAGDPSGLDAPGQTTSAYDLALLGRAALASPVIRGFLAVPRAAVRGLGGTSFEIQNHNELLGSYPGTIGVKNGFTTSAGATYIGAVRRGSHTLIVTLMHDVPVYAQDARALLDWGFANVDSATPVGYLVTEDRKAPRTTPAPGAIPAGGPQQVAAGGGAAGQDDQHHQRHALNHDIGPATWAAIVFTLLVGIITLRRRLIRRRLFPGISALPGMAARPVVRTPPPSSREGASRIRLVVHRTGDDGTSVDRRDIAVAGDPAGPAHVPQTASGVSDLPVSGTVPPVGSIAVPTSIAVPDGATSDE